MKLVFNMLGMRHLEGEAEIQVVEWVCSLEERSRIEVDLCEFSLS